MKQDYGIVPEWRAYELRPGLPPEGIERIPKPGEVNGFPPHLTERANALGLKLKRSPVIACSRPALEIAEYAREHGKFEQFHLAMFKAYWEEARNIGLTDVILDIAGGCGLNVEEVRRCLNEGCYRQSVIEQSDEAKRCGINGIPAYLIGNYLIEGVQPYEFFQQAMQTALKQSKH